MIAPTTPAGSRATMVLPTRVSNSSDSIRSAYPASTVCGSAAWIFVAVRSGQPISLAMVSAISSWRFRPVPDAAQVPGALGHRRLPPAGQGGPSRRHRGVDVRGGGGRHRGDGCSVAGFSTSIVSSELYATHAPLMWIPVRRCTMESSPTATTDYSSRVGAEH